MCSVHCAVCSVQCGVYTNVQCVVCSVWFTQWTVCSLQCAVCGLHNGDVECFSALNSVAVMSSCGDVSYCLYCTVWCVILAVLYCVSYWLYYTVWCVILSVLYCVMYHTVCSVLCDVSYWLYSTVWCVILAVLYCVMRHSVCHTVFGGCTFIMHPARPKAGHLLRRWTGEAGRGAYYFGTTSGFAHIRSRNKPL